MPKENLGRGRRRSSEKGSQSRRRRFSFHKYFTTFFYLFYFSITLLYHCFLYFFLPWTFTHTRDPRPLPTTHDPRQLATLKGLLFMTFNLNAFTFSLAFSAHYYLGNYFVYRNWIDEFLHCQRKTLNFFLTKASFVVTNVDYWHIVGQKQKLTLKATSQVSFCYNKCARYFFPPFPEYFSFRNSTFAFKNYFF